MDLNLDFLRATLDHDQDLWPYLEIWSANEHVQACNDEVELHIGPTIVEEMPHFFAAGNVAVPILQQHDY